MPERTHHWTRAAAIANMNRGTDDVGDRGGRYSLQLVLQGPSRCRAPPVTTHQGGVPMGTRYSAPAFPAAGTSGLSKREYVAAAVMTAIAARAELSGAAAVDQLQPGQQPRTRRWATGLARVAVTLADALLAELGSDQVDGESCSAHVPNPLANGRPPSPAADETVSFDPPPSGADGDDESGVDLGNIEGGNP